MTSKLTLLLIGLLVLSGCDMGSSSTTPAATATPGAPAMGTAAPAAQAFGRPTFSAAARKSDATYTVMLRVFSNPGHARDAAQWRDKLSSALGWKGLTVVTQSDFSVLYWGQFSSIGAASSTLAKAKAYRDQKGNAHFSNASITILPGSDENQPEFELRNCPGQYTLLVADFQNVPEQGYLGRMEDAVAYCRELRAKGQEAYYYHGPSSSSVTVGSFGADAIKNQRQVIRDPSGMEPPLTISQPVVVSPELKNLQKQYPHRLWNLREVRNKLKDPSGQIVSETIPASVPVKVPHDKADYDAFQTNTRAGNRQPR